MFNLFDANNDGVIELDEFREALPTQRIKLASEGSKNLSRKNPSQAKNAFLQSDEEIMKQQKEDDEKWRQIIKEIDRNNDGRISFAEFEHACEKFIQAENTERETPDAVECQG